MSTGETVTGRRRKRLPVVLRGRIGRADAEQATHRAVRYRRQLLGKQIALRGRCEADALPALPRVVARDCDSPRRTRDTVARAAWSAHAGSAHTDHSLDPCASLSMSRVQHHDDRRTPGRSHRVSLHSRCDRARHRVVDDLVRRVA